MNHMHVFDTQAIKASERGEGLRSVKELSKDSFKFDSLTDRAGDFEMELLTSTLMMPMFDNDQKVLLHLGRDQWPSRERFGNFDPSSSKGRADISNNANDENGSILTRAGSNDAQVKEDFVDTETQGKVSAGEPGADGKNNKSLEENQNDINGNKETQGASSKGGNIKDNPKGEASAKEVTVQAAKEVSTEEVSIKEVTDATLEAAQEGDDTLSDASKKNAAAGRKDKGHVAATEKSGEKVIKEVSEAREGKVVNIEKVATEAIKAATVAPEKGVAATLVEANAATSEAAIMGSAATTAQLTEPGLTADAATGATTSGSAVGQTTTTEATSAVKSAPRTGGIRSAFSSTLVKQVSGKIAANFKNNLGKATIILNPPELGKLKVELQVKNNTVKALIATENVVVRDVLEANMSSLRQSLLDQGLNVDELSVVLDDGSRESGASEFASSRGRGNRGGRGAQENRDGGSRAPGMGGTHTSSSELDIFI